MIEASLRWVVRNAPAWFLIADRRTDGIEGRAKIDDTRWESQPIALRVWLTDAGIRVAEVHPGDELPAFCAERHINPNGSFCLGLEGDLPLTSDQADAWWRKVHRFLQLQEVAARTRVWPDQSAWDHGDAGRHQREAEKLASGLGVESEYRLARDNEPSWITDRSLHIVGRSGEPLNGRQPCPRACNDRRGRPILRKDCKRRGLIVALVNAEIARRRELDVFWRELREAGLICCGRMASCGLSAAVSSADQDA